MSFICPEDILKRREQYMFDEFVRQWDMRKSMDKFAEFLNFVSFKHNLNVETVFSDYNEFVKEEEKLIKGESSSTLDDYKNFMDKNEERMTQEFSRKNAFKTSVRGIKSRGNFSTREEAEMNCKKLRRTQRYLRVCYRCGAPRHKCLQDGQCGALGARAEQVDAGR
jgi:predicted HicB family RNase H-like nuclease